MSTKHDFDFLHGTWRVDHRKLSERLSGCVDWCEFVGTSTCVPTSQGTGNVDIVRLEDPKGTYDAIAPRTFDPVDGVWSIWWLDCRYPRLLDTPLVGTFANGVGTFLSNDTFGDTPIVVRFRWTDVDTGSPLWEQAFSPDDGMSWEINWEMRFHRP
jgi:hypothetical protein